MARILLAGLLTLAVAGGTFPLLSGVVWSIGWLLRDPLIFIDYVFTQNRSALNFYVFLSASAAFLYYLLMWRNYVGVVGEVPDGECATVWLFGVGLASLIMAGTWLAFGSYWIATPI